MKIGIDGFNLGLRQGTGIATYAKELSKLLSTKGHEVSTLYGIRRVPHWDSELAWPVFIQQLATAGEPSRRQFLTWGPQTVTYGVQHLLGIPLRARELKRRPHIVSSSVDDKLSSSRNFLNIPSLFRASQAISRVSSRPLGVSLPTSVKLDLFHFTCPLPIKIAGMPNVVTAHDIIPLMLPHSTEVDLRHYKRLTEISLKSADLIVAVSEHSRRDILSSFNISEQKIVTVHQAVDIPKEFCDLNSAEVSHFLNRNYGLQSGRYLLFYGALEPKKNLTRILDAIAAARSNVSLVVVGKKGWLNEEVTRQLDQIKAIQKLRSLSDATQGGTVYHFDYVPFRNLMYLLKGARALIFPSLYEGFGLPVLEAMVMGCPVITSNVSSLPEVGGDAVLYVDPLNAGDFAAAIDKIATDDELHGSLKALGLKQAEKFSPAVHFSKLEQAYATVLKRRGRNLG